MTSRQLTLWAACVKAHPLYARAEAARAGGFPALSAGAADLLALGRAGTGPRRAAREVAARGARVSVIDPFMSWYPGWENVPGDGPRAQSQNLTEDDVYRYADALGAESVTVLAPFAGRAAPAAAVADALGSLADRAGSHGLRLHLEVIPTSMVPDLIAGWELVRAVDRVNVGFVLDTFHLARAGCDPATLRLIPPEKVFHVQLCDGSRLPRVPDYFEEAVTMREFAGEGELPVRPLVQCLADMGALAAVGPEVFSADLDLMTAPAAGRLCREKTDAFLGTLTAR